MIIYHIAENKRPAAPWNICPDPLGTRRIGKIHIYSILNIYHLAHAVWLW